MQLKKIVLTGTPCVGKTTLALKMQQLGYRHLEVDAFVFGPNWEITPSEEVRALVEQATSGEWWVFDGNYAPARDLVWNKADLIVWLDYPLWLTLWRAFWRTLRRFVYKEQLWNGNREHLRHLFSRNSIFLLLFRDWKKRRAQYPEPFHRFSHVPFIRLRTKSATQAWLNDLQASNKLP